VRQPERRFLLDCLAGRAPRPVAGMDWSSFLDCALENGVAALAYERLRDSGGLALLPSYAAEKLHKNYVSKGFRNIGCMEELGEILAALRAANIETIVLKGAAFAGSLWRNPAVRTMRDFDLMVRRSQLEAAGSVLRGMGFMPDERRASEDFYRLSHHHQAPMVHPGHNLIVEIHWNIVAPHDGLCLSPDRLWDRAVEARIAGRDALTLSMEDHILHLCLHAACDDSFHGKIVSVLDIAELLRASQHDWDWNLLLREAEAGGYSRFLYYPLYLAARLFRAPVPAGVLRSLRRASRMGAAEDRLVKACAEKSLLAMVQDGPVMADWRLSLACEIMLFNDGTLPRFAALCGEGCRTLGQAVAKRWHARSARSSRRAPHSNPAPKDGHSS